MTSREKFEAWFTRRYPRSRNGVSTWDGREGSDDYISDYARSHWLAWQARRDEEIELPEPFKIGLCLSGLEYYYADEVNAAIRSAGFKVKGV